MNRRSFLAASLASVALPATAQTGESFEVTRTEAEWRAMLSPFEYRVLREEATERAGSSPLNDEFSDGTYHCRGCDLPLYPSETKFDSNTGWPSFTQEILGAVRTARDVRFGWVRTELHCRRCGSHLGHLFTDGPPPTGLRHCINGVSIVFRAA